jgi:hypothetical protein
MKKDKNKRILELAKADGDDADLILLENIEELEEQVESLEASLTEGLSKITDSSDTHYEIVNKMTKNILNDIKGDKGDDGRNPLTASKVAPINPQIGDLWYKI